VPGGQPLPAFPNSAGNRAKRHPLGVVPSQSRASSCANLGRLQSTLVRGWREPSLTDRYGGGKGPAVRPTLGVERTRRCRPKLLISARCCHGTTARATACCYVGSAGIPAPGGQATSANHSNKAAHRINPLYHQMLVAPQNSAKRNADRSRPRKSWRQISLPLIGELGQLELGVLLPLVFTANVIVAAIVWFVVGSLLR
jgi:hypothetical protein